MEERPMTQKRFSHRECPSWPCHNIEDINCIFCYCPLYYMVDCGGDFSITDKGIKDCSRCVKPHGKDGWSYVVEKLKGNSH